jgi:16S rRNA U516 pseudouridylate synthase RsuA-like enzyme
MKVKYLKRLAIGGLRLDESLPAGGWRELSQAEIKEALNNPALPDYSALLNSCQGEGL